MERTVPDGMQVIAQCATCTNRLFIRDWEVEHHDLDTYRADSLEANHWPAPDKCDACAEREANGAELDKADVLKLSCASQYWDPNGPVAQLMTADGELDLRALDLDNVASIIGEYDRRLRQTLDKIAFERENHLVNYLPITHENRPDSDIDGCLQDMIDLRQSGEHAIKEAERYGMFYLGAKFTELAQDGLLGEELTREHLKQLLGLAEQINPRWADELRPQLFPCQETAHPDEDEVLA